MISKLKYLKGLTQYSSKHNLWENDAYLPSMWRSIETGTVSKNRLRMRCFLTGRFRAVDKRFYLSRMPWKYFAKSGYLPGVKKYSW